MQFELAPFALPDGYGKAIIPLRDAKAHLHVEEDFVLDDELIEVMRDAAVDMVEKYCSIRLAPVAGQVWKAEELKGTVYLGVGQVTAVTSIDYIDDAGAESSLPPVDVRIATHGEIKPAIGKEWPSDVGGGVEITFTAGYPDGQVPAGLIAAAKLFLGHLYANREAVIVGTIGSQLPLGFEQLCARYCRPVI